MQDLKHLNKYLRKYKTKLLIGVFFTVIARVFALFVPNLVGDSITTVERHITSEYLELSEVKTELIINIALIIGAAIVAGGLTFMMRQMIINVSRFIEFDLKNEIYQHYQKLTLNFYKSNRTGDLMNRISEDVGKVRMYFGPALMYSINTVSLFVIVLSVMVSKAPSLTLYTVLPLPVLSFIIYKLSRMINVRSTVVQEYLSKLSSFTQEIFSGISVIKAYAIEPKINLEMDLLANQSKGKNMELVQVQAWFFPMMILLIGISNIIVIFIGGNQYINGEIELGVLAEFILYVNMLTWPVATVGWVTSIVQQAEASQKRINEFLKVTPEIKTTSKEKREVIGAIQFDNVHLTYEDTQIEALQGVSFEIAQGSTVAIMGNTGAGKSTVLDLIGRLYDTSQGVLSIDGVPVTEFALEDLRGAVGYVPQNPFLFSDTIANNIRFGNEHATDQEIIEASKISGVHDNIIEFNDQYETLLGERGVTLSGGQKQRISIARALLKEPKILLLDDSLSAVDTETEELILSNLKKHSKGITTLIVCHRVSSAKNADIIIMMNKGIVVEQGTHEELFKSKGIYKELYEKQLSEKELA
ncbi:MAG: ABC transporter ATP-binding protein [Flavobacteriaceae bacterium]|nr:ABC transporter ATP-binding protein [Flavobacteriaceae bacterium]MDG2314915.1 ABC transporter ATP-binding protein [Flavobacteriaceae bacterium]